MLIVNSLGVLHDFLVFRLNVSLICLLFIIHVQDTPSVTGSPKGVAAHDRS